MCNLPQRPRNKAIAYPWMQYCDCDPPKRVKRRQDVAAWEAWEARQVEADRVWAEWERLSESSRLGGL